MADGSVMLFDANSIINYTKRTETNESNDVDVGCVCHEV